MVLSESQKEFLQGLAEESVEINYLIDAFFASPNENIVDLAEAVIDIVLRGEEGSAQKGEEIYRIAESLDPFPDFSEIVAQRYSICKDCIDYDEIEKISAVIQGVDSDKLLGDITRHFSFSRRRSNNTRMQGYYPDDETTAEELFVRNVADFIQKISSDEVGRSEIIKKIKESAKSAERAEYSEVHYEIDKENPDKNKIKGYIDTYIYKNIKVGVDKVNCLNMVLKAANGTLNRAYESTSTEIDDEIPNTTIQDPDNAPKRVKFDHGQTTLSN